MDAGPGAPNIKLAAFIVTRGRVAQLGRCIRSLGARTSLHVLVNGPDAATESELRGLGIPFQRSEAPLTPASGRNALLSAARAAAYDWAFFIDDDAYVPAGYFERFLGLLEKFPDAGAIGGPNLTPPESNSFQLAAGLALSCRYANFLSTARYHSRGEPRPSGEDELILCNLMVRRDWVDRFRFPETYVCAEENGLLQRLKDAGAAVYHDPELFVFHDRRENARALGRQVRKYGIGRGQNLRDAPGSFRFPYVFPSLVLLSVMALVVDCARSPPAAEILATLALAYAGACALVAIRVSARTREAGWPRLALLCLWIFPVIHFAYAFGVLQGLVMGPGDGSDRGSDQDAKKGRS